MKWIFLFLTCCSIQCTHAQHYMFGRTTGPLPYLAYGLGTDRLGGAKMTYLDSNILMQVIDSTAGDYKVKLSASHVAYLPKQNFKPDSITRVGYYLTSNFKVWGDTTFDYVSIALPERLPYRSMQEIDPAKIIVDIFGATSNTNWITQLKTAREIKNVWQEQLEDDVFRVHIELVHKQHWGYAINYNNNTLLITVKQQPKKLDLKKLKVAIDAGHGGENAGTTGITSNAQEKDYTLKIASQVEKLFKANGINVYMTRTKDTDLTMIERTLMLREQKPDVLLSIHLNSSDVDTVRGVSTYYRYIGFRSLSQAMLNRMLELKLNNFGNIGAFNFSLSGPTEYPNCLVEVAFLSNVADEKKILDPRFHKMVAQQLLKGLQDWLNGMK